MDPIRLADLVMALDGRLLRRPPKSDGWPGYFDGVVHVAGARVLDEQVVFTLSFPTSPDDNANFISLAEMDTGKTDRLRITQSGVALGLTGLAITRTGPSPLGTVPGPHGYQVRLAAIHTGEDTGDPLVVDLLDFDQEVIASAVGLVPRREELNDVLTTSVIARPLLALLVHASPNEEFDVVIDVNRDAGQTRDETLIFVRNLVSGIRGDTSPEVIEQFVFARLTKRQIERMVRGDREAVPAYADLAEQRRARSIYRVWPDFPVHALLDHSIPTIKADAARGRRSASGS